MMPVRKISEDSTSVMPLRSRVMTSMARGDETPRRPASRVAPTTTGGCISKGSVEFEVPSLVKRNGSRKVP